MIAEIADLLTRAGLQFKAREIEDILWLASRFNEPLASDPPSAPAEAASHDRDIDNLDKESDEGSALDEPSKPINARSEPGQIEPAWPLYATGMQGSIAGSTLRVSGPSHSPAPEALRRALQPFVRRVPSRWQIHLDEEATVTRTVDTGFWNPVFTPVREHRFDLTLVIEESTSAELREDTLRDLSRHFRNYSGLREVRCYRLRGDSRLRLVALNGAAEYGIEHLKDHNAHDGRHLILFATDGTSPRWRNGSAQAFIHSVGASTSISLLHLLPRATWRRTLIGEPNVSLHCERPGAPNTRFQTHLPWWIEPDETQEALPVPVLGLDADSAGTWARAISALGGATMPGVLVMRPTAPIAPTMPAPAAIPDPVKLVARYRNMASDPAYRLAVFLSKTNPLTIPIMRLIQRTMLPNSGEGELAEFLLGGLLTHGQEKERQAERLYYFRDGVADELLKALRYSEEETIARQLALVGLALEGNDDEPRNLEVTFPTPTGAPSLCEWALPFATVSQKILRGQIQQEEVPVGARASSDESGVAAARTSLRVLHLSDLHFGDRPSVAPPDRTMPFGPAWHVHLSNLAQNGGIDLVCVSGDLTWTGNPNEFAKLDHFLGKTLEALGLPKSRLFVVPGNHDMRREPGLLRTNASTLLGEGGAIRTELTGTEAAAVASAQSSYREWLKHYLPHQFAATSGEFSDFELSLSGWVVPVRIIGFDSAWMTSIAAGAVLSAEQLQVLKVGGQNVVTLAIMHHQPQQLLAPLDLRERMERARVNLLLHGHGHETTSMLIASNRAPMISSGVALSTQRDRPVVFHVIDLKLDAEVASTLTQITVHEWHERAGKWAEITSNSRPEESQAQPDSALSVSKLAQPNIFVGRGVEAPATRTHKGFLSAEDIKEVVMQEDAFVPGESELRCLLFFSTDKQHSWLVASDHTLAFVLDNKSAGRKARLVQRISSWFDALPVAVEKHRKDEFIVHFGSMDDPGWYCSQSIFNFPSAVENAIVAMVPRNLMQLRASAQRYDELRYKKEPSPTRTQEMQEIVKQMASMPPLTEPDLKLATLSKSSGNNLIAIVSMQIRFSTAYIGWLFECVLGEQAFLAFQAVQALSGTMPQLSKQFQEEIRGRAANTRKQLLKDGRNDPNVHYILNQIISTPKDSTVVKHEMKRILISTTGWELAAYSAQAARILQNSGLQVVENATIESPADLQVRIAQFHDCDLVLLLVGTDNEYKAANQKSNSNRRLLVEVEYEEAVRLGKPIYVLMLEDAPASVAIKKEEFGRMAAFRRFLVDRQLVSFVRTPEELEDSIYRMLQDPTIAVSQTVQPIVQGQSRPSKEVDWDTPLPETQPPYALVIGVGGAGGNVINHLISTGQQDIKFVVANTDAQALATSQARNIVQLGSGGTGAARRVETGRLCAEESLAQLEDAIRGSKFVLIVAGLGGGTGTGAAPVIAGVAKSLGALTIAVVGMPFSYEGSMARKNAESGLVELRKHVDGLIAVSNEKLEMAFKDASVKERLQRADEAISAAVIGISDIVEVPGHINIDVNDIETIFREPGFAIVGTGSAAGNDRGRRAAVDAISSPSFDLSDSERPTGLLINVTASRGLKGRDIKEVMAEVRRIASPNASIAQGIAYDDTMEDVIRVTIIATGIKRPSERN